MKASPPERGRPTGAAWSGRAALDAACFLALLAGLAWLLVRGGEATGYNWQWYRVPGYFVEVRHGAVVFGPLALGLLVTFRIVAASFLLAFAAGLAAVIMRLSSSTLARWVSRAYVEIVRNTPLLVQIFFVYFVVSPILGINAYFSAVVALGLFEGAYISEIFRAGILSVAGGQWEAARSLGLSTAETYRFVILPQAVHKVLPTLAGQSVSLVKDSALVSTIAVYDLAMQAQAIVADTFLVFEVWLFVAAVYLAATMGLSAAAHAMEVRFRRYGV